VERSTTACDDPLDPYLANPRPVSSTRPKNGDIRKIRRGRQNGCLSRVTRVTRHTRNAQRAGDAEIKALFSHSLDPVRSPGSARQDAGGRVAGPQQIVVDLEVLSVEARITIQARHGKYSAKVVLSRWLMTSTLP
jgi:hypothetical protein